MLIRCWKLYVREGLYLYLSKKDIECIGERVYQAYKNLPDVANRKIYRISADKLIEDLLGLNLKYHHLSLDGSVLGVTSSFGGIEYKAFDYDDKETYLYLTEKPFSSKEI